MSIALIEIDEADIEKLNVGFTLYGVYKNNASPELKAAYLMLGEGRKIMSEAHKTMKELQESEQS